jgi:hypothetical protein
VWNFRNVFAFSLPQFKGILPIVFRRMNSKASQGYIRLCCIVVCRGDDEIHFGVPWLE